MHFEILSEDISGKKALDILVPKIIGNEHTFTVHSYKGIGRIPSKMSKAENASKRILLDQLPKILGGYGRAFSSYPPDYPAAVIVVCDLDKKKLSSFLAELNEVLNKCNPAPETRFCIAIEEGEAWFLGDLSAIKKAYPKANDAVLKKYTNDSICDTWEVLADAVHPGGSKSLKSEGFQAAGKEKFHWAEKISPHMDIDNNKSPSFCFFRDCMREISESTP